MTSTLSQLRPPQSEAPQEQQVNKTSAPGSYSTSHLSLTEISRQLGRVDGDEAGPTLICLGGLHGNEPAGVVAIQRILRSLGGFATDLRGQIIGISGNRQALAAKLRFLDHDLNRAWHPDRLTRLKAGDVPESGEDREQIELDEVLGQILEQAAGRVFVLDLHTTSGPGSAFAILDDSLPNREVALDFPVPLVLGLEEELSGTLASYLRVYGVTVLGFEAGQHEDPQSIDRAEAAIWVALESAGMLLPGLRSRATTAREFLAAESEVGRRIFEIRHRHHIEASDEFCMQPGYRNFKTIDSGEPIALSKSGAVRAPRSGLILMPLYQEQGEDGFFIVREVQPFWLPVSTAVRRLRLDRFLHLLPGVQRHPERSDTFIVDLRYARWSARQLFHLLGFRREGRLDRMLIMTRREDQDL